MLVSNFSVVPDIPRGAVDGEQSEEETSRDRSAFATKGHSTRSFVDITFTEDHQSSAVTQRIYEVDKQVEDVFVKRLFAVYPTFVRAGPGGDEVDREMEAMFAKSRYQHFRWAFMVVSFAMMAGTFSLGAMNIHLMHFWRGGLLVGGISPFYLFYGLVSCRHVRTRHFFEKIFVGALCIQTLIVVGAEWASPDFDYGMLVVHIGFVHNFTPLGAGAMQIVTAGFGVFPYIVLKVLHLAQVGADATLLGIVSATENDVDSAPGCMGTSGTEALLVRIVVPIVIFIYQVVVTMRRDESLRLDWLHRLTLRMQERLLAREKLRNEGLLGSMLPRKIIETLKANEPVEPQHFEDVTVIFIEICEFDAICAQLPPTDVVEVLNIVYLEFDRLSDLLKVYKVETVGKVYMAVVGCPEPILNHADVAAHFGLAALRSMRHIKRRIDGVIGMAGRQTSTVSAGQSTLLPNEPTCVSHDSGSPLFRETETPPIAIHVGLNSGPIRAGIVGIDSPRYKLFGDTVNTASRMESTCEPGKIQMSKSTVQRLSPGMFRVETRGEIQVKGKGSMVTHYLCGYQGAAGNAENRRVVVIEHGKVGKLGNADNSDDLASSDQAGRIRVPNTESAVGQAWRGAPPTALFEQEVLRHCTGDSAEGLRTFAPTRSRPEAVTSMGSMQSNNALVSAALGKNSPEVAGQGRPVTASSRDSLCTPLPTPAEGAAVGYRRSLLDRLWLLFLLVPQAHKSPQLLDELRRDLPKYHCATHEERILIARNLTISWLLLTAILAGTDYFMNALDEDLATYRTALIVRMVFNTIAGLVYLLLVAIPTLGKAAQLLTIVMLACQSTALLICGSLLYNNEPAIIALSGVYNLFYTVCTLQQRLLLCVCTILGYVISETVRCGDHSGNSADNISFLVVFIASMACSVRLEEYLQHLSHYEQSCNEKRLQEISLAKAAGWQLLTTLLPPHVVQNVGDGISPIAEHHSEVTIIFTDIKGFTAYSSRITIHKLVTVLNSMYSAFDEVISNWALHKVEIIGDAYFISAGCPPDESEDIDRCEYAMRAVEVGLALLRTLPTVCDDSSVQMRVGLHSGSVVAGVVGKKGPRYHLFGSTVAYAEKMESHGIPGKVQLSSHTHALLSAGGHAYDFEDREIHVEGEEGLQKVFLVNRSDSKAAFQIQKKLMTQRRNHVQQLQHLSAERSWGRSITPSCTSASANATAGGPWRGHGMSQTCSSPRSTGRSTLPNKVRASSQASSQASNARRAHSLAAQSSEGSNARHLTASQGLPCAIDRLD